MTDQEIAARLLGWADEIPLNDDHMSAAIVEMREVAARLVAVEAQETWNPDLTTAPRDQRIKLQLPPYVTGHLTTVVSVEPIAWAPIETESQT